MFIDLVFQSLFLVPNTVDFALSCCKCIRNLLSPNQSQKLEKPWFSCFLILTMLLCWKTIQVSSASSNEMLGTAWGSHLCKVET